jgi:hypothetical protein
MTGPLARGFFFVGGPTAWGAPRKAFVNVLTLLSKR